MIAVNRTGQRRAHGHEEQRVSGIEHADDDRQNERDGAPARAHGEPDERRHQEDDRRQKVEPHAQPVQKAGHELAGTQKIAAAAAERPGQHEDHDGADHGAHAFRHRLHETAQVHELARQEHGRRHAQRHHRADAQAHDRVLADRRGEIDAAEEAAHVHHAQDGEHDEHQDGHDEIPNGAAIGNVQALVLLDGPGGGIVDVALLGHHGGNVRRAFQIDLGLVGDAGEGHRLKRRALRRNAALGIGLSRGHRAEVLLKEQHEEHEEDGEQRVEVVGDGGHEGVEAVLAHVAAHGHRPRGYRRDNADRGRRGVDDPGELLVADAELVRHRAHDGAHGKAVEVVVHEDDDAEQRREDRGGTGVLHVRGHPLRIGAGAAGRSDDHGKRSQKRKE